MSTAKSYNISKLTVWEAYQRVKANRGAAGIDEQSIAKFEQKLQRNLYKVWNRMSSGSYFHRLYGRWKFRSNQEENASWVFQR